MSEGTDDGAQIWVTKMAGANAHRSQDTDTPTLEPRRYQLLQLDPDQLGGEFHLQARVRNVQRCRCGRLSESSSSATAPWSGNIWTYEYFNDYGASAYGIRANGANITLDQSTITAATGANGESGVDGVTGWDALNSTLGAMGVNSTCASTQQANNNVGMCHNGTTGRSANGNSGNSGNPWFGGATASTGIALDDYVRNGEFGEWVGRSLITSGSVANTTSVPARGTIATLAGWSLLRRVITDLESVLTMVRDWR